MLLRLLILKLAHKSSSCGMYACLYVCMYLYMYNMYACMHVRTFACTCNIYVYSMHVGPHQPFLGTAVWGVLEFVPLNFFCFSCSHRILVIVISFCMAVTAVKSRLLCHGGRRRCRRCEQNARKKNKEKKHPELTLTFALHYYCL